MIYFDNAATTKPYKEVLNTFIEVNENYYANPASIHQAGVESNTLLSMARKQIAEYLRTAEEHVLFTAGGTESNNFSLFGITAANIHIGKHIITTEIEHASVIEAANKLEALGFEVDYLKVDRNGVISIDELKQKLRKDTTLVSMMHVNNEIGSVQPIEEAAKIIHEQSRAIFHVDAVQSFGKLPVYLDSEASPDIISFSGHKIHAFKGSGVIAFRRKINITPFLYGGGQEFGLRSGTVAVPQAVALAKAVRLTVENAHSNVEKYTKWRDDLFSFFSKFGEQVRLLSTKDGAPHIVSFAVLDLKGEIMINALQKHGIIVSTSSACSSKQKKTSHVVEAINLHSNYKTGVIRVSFGVHNRDEDIVELKKAFTAMMNEIKGEKVQ